jgi:hypothetical protein
MSMEKYLLYWNNYSYKVNIGRYEIGFSPFFFRGGNPYSI